MMAGRGTLSRHRGRVRRATPHQGLAAPVLKRSFLLDSLRASEATFSAGVLTCQKGHKGEACHPLVASIGPFPLWSSSRARRQRARHPRRTRNWSPPLPLAPRLAALLIEDSLGRPFNQHRLHHDRVAPPESWSTAFASQTETRWAL
jgi:hypothetical protein